MPKYKSVYIAILNQGFIRAEMSALISELPKQRKYNLFVTYPANKPITFNRNKIVQKFLESGMDYLLMMDDDCIPPENILDMADFDKDIIGGLCYGFLNKTVIPFCMVQNEKGNYNVKETFDGEGVVECDAIGSGVMMIKREVLIDFPFPFKNEYDPEGIKIKGLDFNFCKRAKKKGFKVFCHTDFKCSHWTIMDLRTIFETYKLLRNESKSIQETK